LPATPDAEGTPAVRDAASLILVRRTAAGPQVLMGQRGAAAAFMPDKFVFPGGAVDADDRLLDGDPAPLAATLARLAVETAPELVRALPRAAVRELWEETGLMLGVPDAGALVFRAVTPPGRPRRFDARFFVAEAEAVAGAHDDFAGAGDELTHLQWLGLAAARVLPLPFITEVVLSEVEAVLGDPDPGRPVPFFFQGPGGPAFRML
jgi:8-oxo-dGTP pyrophosphatase MutT (NUDIX family)